MINDMKKKLKNKKKTLKHKRKFPSLKKKKKKKEMNIKNIMYLPYVPPNSQPLFLLHFYENNTKIICFISN